MLDGHALQLKVSAKKMEGGCYSANRVVLWRELSCVVTLPASRVVTESVPTCGSGGETTRKQTPVVAPKDAKSTKLVVRNLAFEATKRDLKELFGAFGQVCTLPVRCGACGVVALCMYLAVATPYRWCWCVSVDVIIGRSQLKVVRIPRKFDGTHRGFGFVEFLTHQEAVNAMTSLSRYGAVCAVVGVYRNWVRVVCPAVAPSEDPVLLSLCCNLRGLGCGCVPVQLPLVRSALGNRVGQGGRNGTERLDKNRCPCKYDASFFLTAHMHTSAAHATSL